MEAAGFPREAIGAALRSYHACPRDPRVLGSWLVAASAGVPAGAPGVRGAARGVHGLVRGGGGCPHVRRFGGSSPPGSANHTRAKKRGPGRAAFPPALVCGFCFPGVWGVVGVAGFSRFLATLLGGAGSAALNPFLWISALFPLGFLGSQAAESQ